MFSSDTLHVINCSSYKWSWKTLRGRHFYFILFNTSGKSTTDKLANKLNISDLFMLWPVFIVRSYIQDHLKYNLKKLKNQSEGLISVLRYYLRLESNYALKNEIEDWKIEVWPIRTKEVKISLSSFVKF